MNAAGLHTSIDPAHSTLIFGASVIVVGIFGLFAAVVQHARILNRLNRPDFAYTAMRPIALTVSGMLLLIGGFGLFVIWL